MCASKRHKSAPQFSPPVSNAIFKLMSSGKKTGLLALILCVAGLMTANAAPGWKVLNGHVPAVVRKLSPVGRLPDSQELHLAIGLPLRDPAGLDELLRQLYDPASTNFHKFFQPAELAAKFGPTESDYQAVRQFAESNGLVVVATYSNRMVLNVKGSAADIERAFQIRLNRYRHPVEAREFYAPDSEPSVPADLKIISVEGLNDFSRPRPAGLKLKAPTARPLSFSGTGPGHEYAGNDFRNAYVPGTALTGAGQTVAVLEYSDYYKVDITNYENIVGALNNATNYVPLTNVVVGGVVPGIGNNDEVSLDIEMAIAIAPGLSRVMVYEENSADSSVLSQIQSDNIAKQVSSSWTVGPWSSSSATTWDNVLKLMAAQGQSYFQSSGDSDAYTGAQSLDSGTTVPADSPYATIVGGTTMTMGGYGVAWSSETVWNNNLTGISNEGSGGGISSYYAIPWWQTNISMTSNGGSTSHRNIPDVALTADNVFVSYNNGDDTGTNYFMGTSCAAPLWAGFTALVNQQAVAGGNPPVGFLNPALYGTTTNSNYSICFHDVTTGNNTGTNTAGLYNAVAGYDLCTGLGTPNGQNLISVLAPDTLVITPLSGFSASGITGGSFSPNLQNYLLTNSSAVSLAWSLVNTSAWLNASVMGGTLPPNGTNGVAISLNAAANSLAAGTYPATVQFTNGNTHVVQNLQFSLQVLEPLAITPATGFTASGVIGGPFNVTSQNFTLSNLSSASLNWGIANTSVWLNVSPAGGALAGGGQVTVAAGLNTAASNLTAGAYAATVFFTNQTSGTVQSRQFALTVSQSLVQNGGFETGDFTGWNVTGNSGQNAVVSFPPQFVHSGSYGAFLGNVSTLGYAAQTLSTVPGQLYLVSFWLNNPNNTGYGSTVTPNQFIVNWNTNSPTVNTIFNNTNLGAINNWTNMQFVVKATYATTVLQFGARNDPVAFALDDVSVTPGFAPATTTQPTNLTLLAGGTAVFSAMATGSTNLTYQWQKNGLNLANGTGIAGSTTTNLTLTAVTTNSNGNYSLLVTNIFGATTSSVANLTVVLPPAITSSSVTNRTIQCGGNTNVFTVTATGTAPLSYQWSLDGLPVLNATNTSYYITNLHLPNHTVIVAVTNLYGSLTSNAVLTVQDTISPVITLAGANPFYVELGSAFTDPGATATDLCAGVVVVIASGTVNTNAVSTNTLTYTADDGNGNTNTVTRTVIVRDTTPPTILWSFTNLIVAANSNCVALLPNVTGTNFILATDLSGALTITQTPTNNFLLPLGTNTVVITVADASGNTAFSTNTVVVQDQTPPVIFSQPQSQTNFIGTTATFGVAATACTPLTFQWYSNNTALTLFTNTTLALSNLTLSAAANYFVVASANGGATTSSVATLTVNLIPPAINGVTANANGSFNLNLTGSPGYIYILQATTNLLPPVNWLPLATNTLGTNGVWLFTDTSATNLPLQFYRLKLGP